MNMGLVTQDGSSIALLGVHIDGELLGAYTRTSVTQRYKNAESKPIEAIYTFPLASSATLMGFTMTVNGRKVEGRVMEREEAFQTYDDAIYRGHGAALVDQERSNVFTASVGNLLPGEETLICITYVERVTSDEGRIEMRIPTLVAPRYVPGAAHAAQRTGHGTSDPTSRVPDADRVTPAIGDARYGLTLRFSVPRSGASSAYRSSGAIVVESPSHPLSVGIGAEGVVATFATDNVVLDRDFVIVVRRDDAETFAAVDAHRNVPNEKAESAETKEGTVAVTLVPRFGDNGESNEGFAKRAPKTVVFVVDTSGSMQGTAIEEARRALRMCLRQLSEGDRFGIIEFANTWQAMRSGTQPPPASMIDRVQGWFKKDGGSDLHVFSQATLAQADAFIASLQAGGGTEMLGPIVAATELADDGIVVLLTDGQVANEAEILERVFALRKRTRFYNFAIGTNVSDALLRELSVRTGGALGFIYPGESVQEKVVAQFSRAFAARVRDVRVECQGVDLVLRAPATLPDLVDGDAWTFFARYEKPGEGRVRVTGTRDDGKPFALELPVRLPESATSPWLEKLWAKEQIAELERAHDPSVKDRRTISREKRIVELAVKYQVGCSRTSFVVVEEREGDRRAHGAPEARVIPVSAPHGGAANASAPALGNTGAPPPPQNVRYNMVGRSASRGAPPAAARMRMANSAPPAPASFGALPPPPGAPPAPSQARFEATEEPADEFEYSAVAIGRHAAPKEADGARPAKLDVASADPSATLLEQEASGLWAGQNDAVRVQRTAEALLTLRAAGIDAQHRVYGAQIKKAVRALLDVATKLACSDAAAARCAFAVAWLVSDAQRRGAIAASAKSVVAFELATDADAKSALPANAAV